MPGLSRSPADLRAARDRARREFQDVLRRLEAAARSPDGVTAALERECERARARLAEAVRDLERMQPGSAR